MAGRIFMTVVLALVFMFAGDIHADTHKSIVFMGDSNLWTGGDDCAGILSWSAAVADSLDYEKRRSFARSGATWTNTTGTRVCPECYSEVIDDNNVVYNQWIRVIDAIGSGEISIPDMVIISLGTNDAWFASRRPGMMSVSVEKAFNDMYLEGSQPSLRTSLAESVLLLCRGLVRCMPGARIVITTPPYNTKVSRDAVDEVSEIISDCCQRMKIECISLNDDGIVNPDEEKISFKNTFDGVHLSREGADRVAYRIVRRLAPKE